MSAYADDVRVVVSYASELETFSTILKEYKMVVGAKINADKSVGLWLGSWRSRPMLSDGIVGRRTDRPVKVLGI